MNSFLFLLVALGQLALLVLFVRTLREQRRATDLIPTALTAVLAYENLVIGLGRAIGEGPLLEALNAPRFVGHALLTPLLIVWGLALLRRQKVAWTLKTPAVVTVVVITLGLVAYGIYHDIVRLELTPEEWAGTLRYANANVPEGPPLTAILTGLALLVVGGQLWIESKSRQLLIGAVVMATVAGFAGYLPLLGNIGELVLMFGILSAMAVEPTEKRVPRREISHRARQLGWITWPLFLVGALLTFMPVWGTMDPAADLPVSPEQYDFASASQGVWLVLMTLHAHFSISVFGLARGGSRLRKFHVWFGYANLLLTFGGQLFFIFPQTATLGSRATELVFITITVHVLLGTWFAFKRRTSRTRRTKRAKVRTDSAAPR